VNIVNAAPDYVFASPAFVQRLINRGRLVEFRGPRVGTLIVYAEDGCTKHIGKMVALDRVESKWGVGLLYHHGILEVPAHYGSEVRHFEAIYAEEALDELAVYAKEHGVKFEGDA
jgi:hypothetical protein